MDLRCERCHRKLRDVSPERGRCGNLGRSCHARRMRAVAALRASGNKAAEAAAELVELHALVPMKRSGFYRVPSSDGKETYITCSRRCNCPAGLHDKLCKHSVAATVMAA